MTLRMLLTSMEVHICYSTLDITKLFYYGSYVLLMLQIIFIDITSGENAKYFTTAIPAFLEKPQNSTYTAGELAILYCSVINLGTKTVVWKRADENNPLTIGTLTFAPDDRFQVKNVPHKDQWNLIIKNVKKEDEGEYECQISTTDRSLRQSVYLKVEEKPEMTPGIEISGNTYVEKGDKIILVCNATTQYYPPEAPDWFRNGNRITTDEDAGIKISKKISLKENTITSILEIDKAQMEDDANYVCRSSDLLITNIKLHVLNAGTSKERRGTLAVSSAASILHQCVYGKSGAIYYATILIIVSCVRYLQIT
ncbi:hypothetical protein CHS0354_032687 [Potamilus streckersoni]|uniref:Ig-like domain-containing protein n=1 Tax=Potamilus streckersoni TaxID=2493646 RepID=A0AAE0SQQ9_9BIVA|nr:hypothetical protein CHS0354_032687 [Potamilus streckersoni]